MNSTHQHTWGEWSVRPIKIIQQRPEPNDYYGTAGDKAFLVQQCTSCPKVEPRDFGPTEAMREKLERLTENTEDAAE